jgi:transposase-like protein
MVGEDKVIMSVKELRRLHVIHQVIEKKMTQVTASGLLGLTDRQIRRIVKRVREIGDGGIAHQSRGKPSHRRIDERIKTQVIGLYEKRYGDFGPTLAAEKLWERNEIRVSDETLRLWLLEAGVTHFKRRKRPHRSWRQRKAHRGELVQMDGSHHAWLEDRGPECVLMAYIDDASSRVLARFYAYEGTIPAMDSFKRYVKRHGLPLAVYADKHSTYKSPAEPTLAEQLAGQASMSQFERSLSELGVEMIHAHSPQAKGRIERLFETFQDRLIKEMRLAGIQTMEEANRFLSAYLPIYNQRFGVKPTGLADLHRPRPSERDLDNLLCLKTERTLRKDFTVAYNGRWYQIHDNVRTPRVMVQERLDGTLHIQHQGQRLRYQEIAKRPVKVVEAPRIRKVPHQSKPEPGHPWLHFRFGRKEKELELAHT